MPQNELANEIKRLLAELQKEKIAHFQRRVSSGDLLTDRSENAQLYGFGEGTTCYDNVLVLGSVKVGRNCWIGPNCILDGSGGELFIGDFCSISAGVQIYTHNTVEWALTMGQAKVETGSVRIGSGVYVGPQCVIQMGVTIGDRVVIGAMSFVNGNVPSESRVWGIPAKIHSLPSPAGVRKDQQ